MPNLHINVKADPPQKGEVLVDEQTGIVMLPEAGNFTVSIVEYENEKAAIKKERQAIRASNQDIKKQLQDLSDPAIAKYNAKTYNKMLDENEKKMGSLFKQIDKLQTDYNDVRWVWQLVNGNTHLYKESFNASLGKGIKNHHLKFPKLLEGGGLSWLEAYHYKTDTPTFKIGNGFYMAATGTPGILSVEWRDGSGNLLTKAETEHVAYGSTVYLHIYTEALYGQEIEISLIDHFSWYNPTTDFALPLNKMENGMPKPTQGKPSLNKTFIRKVEVLPDLGKKDNVVADTLTDKTKNGPVNSGHAQKVILPVYIDPFWHSLDTKNLNIICGVKHAAIKEPVKFTDNNIVVDINKPMVFDTATTGNSPVLVSDGSVNTRDQQKKKDFTFGVFIDGTMNNKYNTIAREDWENKRIKAINANADVANTDNHLKVHAKSKKDVGKNENYKYAEISYENALSNPAIIYQYYKENPTSAKHPTFLVYSEGMGTDTEADINGKVKSYETDDIMEGPAFGMGSAGILDRVEKAIDFMVGKMTIAPTQTIGTITVDVFGFSRGAAAARNFVSNICYPSYEAKIDGYENSGTLYDRFGYFIESHKYNSANPVLPANGYLGYLIAEKGWSFDRLVIRFAGLFDSVPHHGLFQGNDIEDLGLNDIIKADYTVHLVAGDEHRSNFSLVDISCITGKKGGGETKKGIELYLPGVHCDVGGSYVEGRPEKNNILQGSINADFLQAERNWMVEQGWYHTDQLIPKENNNLISEKNYDGMAYRLGGNRNYVSNQYSFIPLYIMVSFATNKGITLTDGFFDDYKFTHFSGQWNDNINFLTDIHDRLMAYAFKSMERFDFVPHKKFVTPRMPGEIPPEYEAHQKEGQDMLDREIAENNAAIKKLRNRYLHFNANYDDAIGVNTPRRDGREGPRQRKIRGAVS